MKRAKTQYSKNKMVKIMLLGLFLCLSGLNPSFAKEKKEKMPKGLQTKTEINYKFVEEFGQYKKVLDGKTIYRYDDQGNEIGWAKYDDNGRLFIKSRSKYDDQGNLIEWTKSSAQDTLISKKFYIYKYDNKGNKIEGDLYFDEGALNRKFFFKYDDKGNMIDEASYYADGQLEEKTIYKYDDKGNEIEWTEYRGSGTVEAKTIYKYDAKGNLIEETLYSIDGRFAYKYLYKYDIKNSKIERAKYDAQDTLVSKNLYKYDDKGNLIENASSGIDSTSSWKDIYKYDDQGNITERTNYRKEGKFGETQEVMKSQTVLEYNFLTTTTEATGKTNEDVPSLSLTGSWKIIGKGKVPTGRWDSKEISFDFKMKIEQSGNEFSGSFSEPNEPGKTPAQITGKIIGKIEPGGEISFEKRYDTGVVEYSGKIDLKSFEAKGTWRFQKDSWAGGEWSMTKIASDK